MAPHDAPTRLRKLLQDREEPLVLPGASNALTAIMIKEAAFQAVYVTGAGVTNTYLGVPDIGLLTLDELVNHVSAMTDAVDLPFVVDADTGFGNALNVQRTVRRLERAGAAAIQLEDQVTPKKCGHFGGNEVISAGEMTGKIRAAVDARSNDDLIIVARTDARAMHGIDSACERAAAYLDAGADVLFVEAPRGKEEMLRVTSEVPGLHIANMVEGGMTPLLTKAELSDLGYSIVLYANTALRGAVAGTQAVLAHLAQNDDTKDAGRLIISWEERQALVHKSEFEELERRYHSDVLLDSET